MSIHGMDDTDQEIDNERLLCVLTSRQMEVIRLRINGLTLDEIGEELGIPHQVVSRHIQAIRKRLIKYGAKKGEKVYWKG